jgi:hypothetical protein
MVSGEWRISSPMMENRLRPGMLCDPRRSMARPQALDLLGQLLLTTLDEAGVLGPGF